MASRRRNLCDDIVRLIDDVLADQALRAGTPAADGRLRLVATPLLTVRPAGTAVPVAQPSRRAPGALGRS